MGALCVVLAFGLLIVTLESLRIRRRLQENEKETDQLRDELSQLKAAVRKLLDGVNARYPLKTPREWTCPDMAELDRIVPLEVRTVSRPGAALEVKAVGIPPRIQDAMAKEIRRET